MKILILGAGVSGLATALALSKHLKPSPQITIVELRPQLSSIGGAIGLTPNALRALKYLGVWKKLRAEGGKKGCAVGKIELFGLRAKGGGMLGGGSGRIGEIDFTGAEGESVGAEEKLQGLRIMRKDLVQAMLDTVREKENVTVSFGRKVVEINEGAQEVVARFEDGEQLTADVLVGCDGVHSSVRRLLVEPDRQPDYTGIAAVFGFTDIAGVEAAGEELPWKTTALCQGQRGSLLCSFCEETRRDVFIAAIMETKDVTSKEGWKAKASEQEQIKKSVWERYSGSQIGCLNHLIEKSRDWTLYPVYTLGPRGKWSGKRTMLLGDAGHAMPPQGESGGMALEDAILFARVMAATADKDLTDRFAAYEKLRRPHADKAYKEASFGWETQKDSGWLAFQFKLWMTWLFLWWTASGRQKRYSEDIATSDLGLD